jgi:hypothetical protein
MAKTRAPKRRKAVGRRKTRQKPSKKRVVAVRRRRASAARKTRRNRPAVEARRPQRASPRKPAARRAASRPQAPRKPTPRPKPSRPPASPPDRLQRERRVLSDVERLEEVKIVEPMSVPESRMIAAARAGHDELRAHLQRHNETSPTLTAGDLDAKWEDAYAVGDEAPGGDNPTPEQDRVDDIGKALGVEYQDDQELQGGDEITERDHHRWELDPASSDDWPHNEK